MIILPIDYRTQLRYKEEFKQVLATESTFSLTCFFHFVNVDDYSQVILWTLFQYHYWQLVSN